MRSKGLGFRRQKWLTVGGVLVLAFSLLLNAGFLVRAWRENVVVSVPDGDSLQMADGRRVRLLGVDAPERGRCLSDAARERLIELVQGRHVRLKNVVTDDYGRSLAYVIVEEPEVWGKYLLNKIGLIGLIRPISSSDPFLNRVLVGEGLAQFSGGQDEYYDTLKSASEKAKADKLGIYSAQCRSATPDLSGCDIKGNIREGKKVYYPPGCRYYDQVIVDKSYGDAWFCDESAAQAANYTKAASCL